MEGCDVEQGTHGDMAVPSTGGELTDKELLGEMGDSSQQAAEDVQVEEVPPLDVQEEAGEVHQGGDVAHNEGKAACYPVYEFEGSIQLITGAWRDFRPSSLAAECFTKGCKWAPDGTCILTNSDDNVLRVYDLPRELHCQEAWPVGRTLPEMKPALHIHEGGLVYDYCWYPLMSSWDPLSCCLLSTSMDNPVHLWDAYTGELRCTYRPYNSVDEVEHAYSVAFSAAGDRLYCGFKDRVRLFTTALPGRSCQDRLLKGCGKPVGIVSCISVNPAMDKLYAVGTYLKMLALCTEPEGNVMCILLGQNGGVTHMTFAADGTKLYVGGRKDSEMFCWDMRKLGTVLYTMEREVNNNQRIYFDVTSDSRYIMSGGTNGKVNVWDTLAAAQNVEMDNNPRLPVLNAFKASDDCVNGVSLHRQYPLLATSSGQRHFELVVRDSDTEEERASPPPVHDSAAREDSLKLWWLGRAELPP